MNVPFFFGGADVHNDKLTSSMKMPLESTPEGTEVMVLTPPSLEGVMAFMMKLCRQRARTVTAEASTTHENTKK